MIPDGTKQIKDGHTIRQYCDRGAILAGGRLELFDDIASAFERYRRMLAEPST